MRPFGVSLPTLLLAMSQPRPMSKGSGKWDSHRPLIEGRIAGQGLLVGAGTVWP